MKNPAIVCVLLTCFCIALLAAGCTSSSPAAGTTPASTTSAPSPAVPSVSTTPACPDKLVWDGNWESSELGMAGNHDLSTAWTKYPDRAYGDTSIVKMTQTCWDVKGILPIPGIKCDATFTGTVVGNTLSGTWSGSKTCSKGESGRKFSITMGADNKSWLGDLYDDSQDPAKFPPNWAGRKK